MYVYGIDHIQLAIPPDTEHHARRFYGEVLGLTEVPKPEPLRARGGAWFESGTLRLHLGADRDFVPARKAHPGLLVEHLDELIARCEAGGHPVHRDAALDGFERAHVFDPFGNRLELLERRPQGPSASTSARTGEE